MTGQYELFKGKVIKCFSKGAAINFSNIKKTKCVVTN